ncbi:MAG: hypothetical protein ACRD40_13840, partial [Candidatus Acidiferrales bacterium]
CMTNRMKRENITPHRMTMRNGKSVNRAYRRLEKLWRKPRTAVIEQAILLTADSHVPRAQAKRKERS